MASVARSCSDAIAVPTPLALSPAQVGLTFDTSQGLRNLPRSNQGFTQLRSHVSLRYVEVG